MRIGLRVPQYAAGWQGCRDAALHAEDLGFAHLWVNDHFRTPGRDSLAPALDALTTLAALAPLTSRARLGVAVLSASYRAPAVTAIIRHHIRAHQCCIFPARSNNDSTRDNVAITSV